MARSFAVARADLWDLPGFTSVKLFVIPFVSFSADFLFGILPPFESQILFHLSLDLAFRGLVVAMLRGCYGVKTASWTWPVTMR